MRWQKLAGLYQGPIQDNAHLADRQHSVHLLAIDEHSRSSFDTLSLTNGRLYAFVLLGLDAGLEFCPIQIMFLPLHQGQAIEQHKLSVATLFRIHFRLVGMEVVGEIPIGILVLRCQAVGAYCGVGSPGVTLGQREILVDENDRSRSFSSSGNSVWWMREQKGHSKSS